jgi:YggT family protein
MGAALVWLVNSIFGLVIFAIFAQFVISLLIAFDIINTRNAFVGQIKRFLDAVVNPMLRPFQRFIPILGGVDISPIVLLLAIQFIRILFNRMIAPLLIGTLG